MIAGMAMVILLASCDAAGSIVGNRDDIWQGVKDTGSYTITFNPNGGSYVPSQTVKKGGKAIRPDNPEKEGFSFVHWTGDSGSEWHFNSNAVTTDITLYAQWQELDENSFNIIFKPNNGSVIDNQVVEKGDRIIQPEGLELTRSWLEGWYKDGNYPNGTRWDFGVSPAGSITLYARWIALEPNQYTVRFIAEGGFPAPYDAPAVNGATVAQPAAMTKGTIGTDAETFGGWYQNEERTIPWIFENDTVTGSITLYARWNPYGYYTVNFDANGGTPSRHQKIIKAEAYITEAIPITKTGYTARWYMAPNYSTEWILAAGKVTDNQTLRAEWIPNTLSISYASGGGTGNAPTSPTSAVYGSKVIIPINSYTRDGYTFTSWQVSGAGSITGFYIAGEQIAVTELSTAINNGNAAILLTAMWNENIDFSITFAQLQDLAPNITGPVLHLVGNASETTKTITVANPGQYDSGSIQWFYKGNQISGPAVTGSAGETLTVSSDTYSGIGTYFVTVEVKKEGDSYSKVISFEVKP